MEHAELQHEENLGTTLKWSVIGLVTLVGLGWGAVYLYKRGISNAEESESLEDGNAATFAKQFELALKNRGYNTGSDMKMVRDTALQIPTQALFQKVEKSFNKLFQTPMAKTMTDTLKPSQYAEVLAIKGGKPLKDKVTEKEAKYLKEVIKPLYWAKRYNAAFALTWGPFDTTDNDSLNMLLNEIPTQTDLNRVKNMYKGLYHVDLLDTIKKEMSFLGYYKYKKALDAKPK